MKGNDKEKFLADDLAIYLLRKDVAGNFADDVNCIYIFFLFRRTSSYKIKKNKNKNKEQDCKRFSKSFSPCLGSCISKTQRRFSYNISISLVIIFGSNPDGSA